MEAGSLQSILATLAQFGSYAAPNPTQITTTADTDGRCLNPHLSLASDGTTTPPGEPSATASTFIPHPDFVRIQTQSGAASPKPMIDPASITQWQEALRCVTKIAAQNAHFAIAIKKMMHDQKTHEMRWYTERQNLKQVQSNRSASAANARKILNSLPAFGSAPASGWEHTEINKEAELAEFDGKIYGAQQAMEASMTIEMKRLGVPFFGTDSSLILEDGRYPPTDALPEGQPKFSPLVTETQLIQMRRKMIAHLEDLYRD